MKVIMNVPDEGYYERTCYERTWWRLLWTYLMKVNPETCCAHYIWYLRVFFISDTYLCGGFISLYGMYL